MGLKRISHEQAKKLLSKSTLINDIYDVLAGNSIYITQEDFIAKYVTDSHIFVSPSAGTIEIGDKYRLTLTEIESDPTGTDDSSRD